jgi:hypothetical protein
MKDLLMENKEIKLYNIIKYIILGILTIVCCSTGRSQDCYSKGIEYHVAKAQYDSNFKQTKLIQYQKDNLNIFNKKECIERSRLQAVISAKDNENFRLKRKMDHIIYNK